MICEEVCFAADATFDFLTLRAFLGSVFLEVVTGV